MASISHTPNELPPVDNSIEEMDPGFRFDMQCVQWRNLDESFVSFPSRHDMCNNAKLFHAMLQELWINIKKHLSEEPYQRYVLCNAEVNQNFTILEDSLSMEQRYQFLEFFFDVTQLMVDRHCTNLALMADCLELVCEICYYKVISRNLIPRLQQSYFSQNIYRYTTHFQKLMHLPYKIAHNEVDSLDDEIKRAAAAGYVGLLDVLLKFGVTMLRPQVDDFKEHIYTWAVMKGVFNKYLMPGCINRNLNEIHPDERCRLFLLMRILNVIPKIRLRPERAKEYVRCVNLMFDSIPDPVFTVNEVENSVKKACKGSVTQEGISVLCDEIELHFPDSCKPSGPRTLQHLCRVQVRESVRSHKCCFQAGVKSLPLPSLLKRYILLEDGKTSDPKPIITLQKPRFRILVQS